MKKMSLEELINTSDISKMYLVREVNDNECTSRNSIITFKKSPAINTVDLHNDGLSDIAHMHGKTHDLDKHYYEVVEIDCSSNNDLGKLTKEIRS